MCLQLSSNRGLKLNTLFSAIGFCRFASERGPLRALAAADQGTLTLSGSRPYVSLIQNLTMVGRPTPLGCSSMPRKPTFLRRKSHQRNTISIDTSIVESPPFLRLMNEITIMSPLEKSPSSEEEKRAQMFL